MSKIALSGDPSGTGTFTIASPNSNSNFTLTLPTESGTIGVNSSPAGTVIFYAANTAPTGFLKANGANVSRTTYAALFAAIGTTFGSGDGSTTFGLPDLRGEFVRGWDDGRSIDSGRVFGSAQLDQMQKLSGTWQPRNDYVNSVSGVFSFGATVGGNRQEGVNSVQIVNFDSGNSPNARVSSTTAGETRARNVALLACIKF